MVKLQVFENHSKYAGPPDQGDRLPQALAPAPPPKSELRALSASTPRTRRPSPKGEGAQTIQERVRDIQITQSTKANNRRTRSGEASRKAHAALMSNVHGQARPTRPCHGRIDVPCGSLSRKAVATLNSRSRLHSFDSSSLGGMAPKRGVGPENYVVDVHDRGLNARMHRRDQPRHEWVLLGNKGRADPPP